VTNAPAQLTQSSANLRGLVRPDWLAVNLDSVGAHSAVDFDLAQGTVHCENLPPAALLPRFSDEPLRGDVTAPPHPRGSGLHWPPEARADSGSGRWPVALAWDRLRSGLNWTWQFDGESHKEEAANAIAAALAAVLLSRTRDARIRPDTVLVVPDDLREQEQQALIDGCQRIGIVVKLIWRPVAAALAWLRLHEKELLDEFHSELSAADPGEDNVVLC
jgi:hypothetical protein